MFFFSKIVNGDKVNLLAFTFRVLTIQVEGSDTRVYSFARLVLLLLFLPSFSSFL